MLGVWAFFYAFVHVLVYLTTDRSCFSLATSVRRSLDRHPAAQVHLRGTDGLHDHAGAGDHVDRRVGAPLEEELSAAQYVAGIAGVVHFIWIQKSDISEPFSRAGYLVVPFRDSCISPGGSARLGSLGRR